MPKLSYYNHFFPYRDGYYLAFNAATGAVAMMTAENYSMYQKLCECLADGRTNSLTQQEKELLTQLQYGKFVIESDWSEQDQLRFKYRRARFDPMTLGLVIAPTMACNMACRYCFEENKKGRMTPRVVEALITFVENQARALKDVQITWYGGEPLLAVDVMEDIAEAIFDLEREYKFTCPPSSMFSNGYLLTPETTDRLVRLRVGQVLITLDGPARLHNQKRPLKNGRESFDTILDNISHAVDKLAIGIRVNVDKSFSAAIIEELLDEIEARGLREKVGVLFGQLEPATTACANISENCHESRSYSDTEIEYYRLLLNRGFIIQKLPQPILSFCIAQLMNSYLIDPDGDMYRCFNHAGDKSKSMGNIQAPVNYQHVEFDRLFSFDPFDTEACRSCTILPLCMGGCAARRKDRHVAADEVCDTWKYNLQPMLEIIAQSRQQQRQRQMNQATQETSK